MRLKDILNEESSKNIELYKFYVVDTNGKKIVKGFEELTDAKKYIDGSDPLFAVPDSICGHCKIYTLDQLKKSNLTPHDDNNWADYI